MHEKCLPKWKKILYFRDQVAYSQQIREMTHEKPITEAERMKAQSQRRAQIRKAKQRNYLAL